MLKQIFDVIEERVLYSTVQYEEFADPHCEGAAMTQDFRDRLGIPSGFRLANVNDVAEGAIVYVLGSHEGHSAACGPHRVIQVGIGHVQLENHTGGTFTGNMFPYPLPEILVHIRPDGTQKFMLD